MTVFAMTQLVSAPGAYRRRRFMESSDFNGAAKYIFNGLRKAVADGRTIGAVFIAVEMDPATPSVVTSAVTVSLQQKEIALAMSGHLGAPGSMEAAFKRLLAQPDTPTDLAVYVGPENAVGREHGDVAKQSVGLRLEIRSVDLAAVTVFRLRPEAAPKLRMAFAPLNFRGLIGA